jgi:hypothetical protein
MENVLVSKEELQKVVDYIMQNEEQDFLQCQNEEWSEDQLENHVFAVALNLQLMINNQ